MAFRKSDDQAASLAFALTAQYAIYRLEATAWSTKLPVACPSRSTLLGICQNRASPSHSEAKGETQYSPCPLPESRSPCSCALIATLLPSLSQAGDADSLISSYILAGLVPVGVKPVTKQLSHYRQLERRLWMTRWKHGGKESAGEDVILDEMESVWMDLTDDERATLRLEGPRCWPTDPSSLPPELNEAMGASAPTQWSYEGFRSPAEAILSSEAA